MRKHITHLHRIWRLRKRVKLILLVGFFLYASVLSQIYAAFWVYPNTHVGRSDISGSSKKSINQLIEKYPALTYRVRIQNREYEYTYADLGIVLDPDIIKKEIFTRNKKPFPLNTVALVQSFFRPTQLEIPLVFTQEFIAFIDQTVFDFSETTDTVSFDPNQKTLEYIENEERYRIDEAYFVELLRSRVGDNAAPLYPKLTRIQNEKALIMADVSDRIKRVFLTPVTVLIKTDGITESFILSENELVDIVHVNLSPDQTTVQIDVNQQPLIHLINEHVKKLKILARGNVVTPKVVEEMRDLLTARFNGHTADALTINFDTGPNTTGSISDTYIEVDISQQKMYLFQNGKPTKEYRVSTGLDYPTPTGEFTILNKVGLGYSTIYDVWLPWWMGFKYSNELDAYFGIHELPYKLSGDQTIQRPSNFIGQPNTGGCVALGVGDAQEVYRFADIGTKVVIYN